MHGQPDVDRREQQRVLREIALASIRHGLAQGKPLPVTTAELPGELRQAAASFVTLEIAGRLRGCIGSLQAHRPLGIDVAENAFAAAFRDPRFPPLTTHELARIDLHISVLSPPEPFPVRDEADLLARLRPGIDGLILADGDRRATFLPSVWEQLPTPREFLAQLKRKAGLPPGHWSPTIRFSRYTTEIF